jgi:predicted nucleic acid-binding protein
MILIDSSVWIEYFRGNEKTLPLNELIDTNSVCMNDLILAELLPSINHKKVGELRELLLTIQRIPLDISWTAIIHLQTKNLKKGINKAGIADLIPKRSERSGTNLLVPFPSECRDRKVEIPRP